MNILYYIEPSIENNMPKHSLAWGLKLVEFHGILEKNKNYKECFLCSKVVSKTLQKKLMNLNLVSITYKEYWNCFGKISNLTKEFYSFFEPKPCFNKYAKLLKKKLATFEPDIILVFNTPADFLRNIFPSATLLHIELGMLSRPPFPMSYYFDPYGQYENNFISKHCETLKNYKLNQNEKKDIDAFNQFYFNDILTKRNPIKSVLEQRISKFQHSILAPLQYSNFSDFQQDTTFGSQIDLIFSILNSIPEDTCLIVTQHPNYKLLNKDIVENLQNEFSNFIYLNEFDDWYATSQYILPMVEAVFTTYSSLGLQALLLDKILLSIGSSGIAKLSHCTDFSQFSKVIAEKQESRQGSIYYLLRYYYILETKLMEPNYFYNLLLKIKEQPEASKISDNSIMDYLANPSLTNVPSHVPKWDAIEFMKKDPNLLPFYEKFEATKNDVINLEKANKTLKSNHLELQTYKDYLENSLSWRLTAPLRKLWSFFKKDS